LLPVDAAATGANAVAVAAGAVMTAGAACFGCADDLSLFLSLFRS